MNPRLTRIVAFLLSACLLADPAAAAAFSLNPPSRGITLSPTVFHQQALINRWIWKRTLSGSSLRRLKSNLTRLIAHTSAARPQTPIGLLALAAVALHLAPDWLAAGLTSMAAMPPSRKPPETSPDPEALSKLINKMRSALQVRRQEHLQGTKKRLTLEITLAWIFIRLPSESIKIQSLSASDLQQITGFTQIDSGLRFCVMEEALQSDSRTPSPEERFFVKDKDRLIQIATGRLRPLPGQVTKSHSPLPLPVETQSEINRLTKRGSHLLKNGNELQHFGNLEEALKRWRLAQSSLMTAVRLMGTTPVIQPHLHARRLYGETLQALRELEGAKRILEDLLVHIPRLRSEHASHPTVLKELAKEETAIRALLKEPAQDQRAKKARREDGFSLIEVMPFVLPATIVLNGLRRTHRVSRVLRAAA